MQYAKETTVPVERSKAEIESTIVRYGASSFASGWEGNEAIIGFQMNGKRLKFVVILPNPNDEIFTQKEVGRSCKYKKTRGKGEAVKLWEKACRQRWRAMALSIKAKLEAVECGITTFEEEFLPHFVVPASNGKTVGQIMIPELEKSYLQGHPMPKLLT